jgi:hypothetical protein
MITLDPYHGRNIGRAMTAFFGSIDHSTLGQDHRHSGMAAEDRIAEPVTHLQPIGMLALYVRYRERVERGCRGPGNMLETVQIGSEKRPVATPEMAPAASSADFKKCEKVILKMRNRNEKNTSGYRFSIPVIINFNYHG